MTFDKLFPPKNNQKSEPFFARSPRERRVKERVVRHMTFAGPSDVLKVLDFSPLGIKVKMSVNAYAEFEIGKIYGVQFRFEGQVFKTHIQVIRKEDPQIGGFVFFQPTEKIKKILEKIHQLAPQIQAQEFQVLSLFRSR